jgi:acetyltransferase-like isoleucine patch superfamily enzyme
VCASKPDCILTCAIGGGLVKVRVLERKLRCRDYLFLGLINPKSLITAAWTDSVNFSCPWRLATGPAIVLGNSLFTGRNYKFSISKRYKNDDDCLIASGCKFIDHNHGAALNTLMNIQASTEQPISLENNMWLGVNVVVLNGVSIGSGAMVVTGAGITKNIGANEIWANIPACKLRRPGLRNL